MPITTNTALKNSLLDGIDAVFNNGTCVLYTGTPPGAGNAATGTVLATINLGADSFAAASGGTKAKTNTWTATATGAGVAGYFRLINSGATQILEGNVTTTGGGGDITLDNTNIAVGQSVTINTFVLNNAN